MVLQTVLRINERIENVQSDDNQPATNSLHILFSMRKLTSRIVIRGARISKEETVADMGDESIMNTASDPLLEKYGDDAPITMAEDTASVASDISFSGIFIRLAQN